MHSGLGPELAGGRLLGHPVLITMSAFGSQLILSAVARVNINIIGDDVQLGVGCELADDMLLGHPHHALLVLVRTRRFVNRLLKSEILLRGSVYITVV